MDAIEIVWTARGDWQCAQCGYPFDRLDLVWVDDDSASFLPHCSRQCLYQHAIDDARRLLKKTSQEK